MHHYLLEQVDSIIVQLVFFRNKRVDVFYYPDNGNHDKCPRFRIGNNCPINRHEQLAFNPLVEKYPINVK